MTQRTLLAPLFLSAVLLLTGLSQVVQAADSLYDIRLAEKPDTRMTSMFGPRAGGIRYDKRMIQAAQIAQSRARAHSVASCWRYVKTALLDAKVIDSRPTTAYAKQAGGELLEKYGFRRVSSIRDPYSAPVGSVLVYGGKGAGHVEIRTRDGFVSDFSSKTPSKRPLIGVFVKPS